MAQDKLTSPLLLKYLKIYEKNPRSTVFAPLAESYRKLGMTQRAIEVLRDGIRYNPSYVMGYLGLANCYSDLGQYQLSYTTLRPLVNSNRENIRLQKLFASVCQEIGHIEEALDTYKYLLFINPKDQDSIEQVGRLESAKTAPIFVESLSSEKNTWDHSFLEQKNDEIEKDLFDIEEIPTDRTTSDKDLESWKKVDWFEKKSEELLTKEMADKRAHANLQELVDKQYRKEEKQRESNKNNIFDQIEKETPAKETAAQDVPVITHTLVDLYCGQGHLQKALDILKKISELNPDDQKTLQKIEEVKNLMAEGERSPLRNIREKDTISESSVKIPVSKLGPKPESKLEDEGREKLMGLLDRKLKNTVTKKKEKIEKQLNTFLLALQKKAHHLKSPFGLEEE
jgi:tetratricopeptide (TPR) repeat protein